MRWVPAVLVAALPSLLSIASFAAHDLTVPPSVSSGCAVFATGGGGPTSDSADLVVMSPEADRREVTLIAAAASSASFPNLYVGTMSWNCGLSGAATLEYGSASGALTLSTSSVPEALDPDKANQPNPPFQNDGNARGEGVLRLQFDDTGVVVSDVLADGTPVQLEFTFLLESTAILVGSLAGPQLSAGANYTVSARDLVEPSSAEAILLGTQQVTRTLDTAVGRTIDLHGLLTLSVHARAGEENPGEFYYPMLEAEIDASNSSHFLIETPEDVSFVAESGRDYTSLPAPGEALLFATGTLVLAA